MATTTHPLPKNASPVLLSGKALSFPVFVAAIFAVIIYLFIPQSMVDPDIWWHLRNAQFQIQSHSFIHSDMFSYTAFGDSWMNHEWLAEIPFYLGWKFFGAKGLFFVTVAAIETILLGVLYLAYRKSGNIKSALLVSAIAGVLATVSYGPRTLLFGWICLIIELAILDRMEEDHRVLWGLPPLFLLWVNTHGSWLIGLVLLTVFAVCGNFRISAGTIECAGWSRIQRRTLAIVTGLSVSALFANPYGWRLVFYPFDLAYRQKLNVANIQEWFTLDFHSVRGKLMLVSLALLFLFQILRPRRWRPYELAFLFIGVYASFNYTRFLFLAGILVLPLLARDIPWFSPYQSHKNKPLLNALILLGLIPLVVTHTPDDAHIFQGSKGRMFPDQALPYLRNFHPEGRVLNDFLWGGYLIYHTPQIPVFADSRVDIFEYNGAFGDYLDLIHMKNSLAILDKYKIRYVLFEKDTPLVYLLQHTPGWKIDYQDDSTILLERAPAQLCPDPLLSARAEHTLNPSLPALPH